MKNNFQIQSEDFHRNGNNLYARKMLTAYGTWTVESSISQEYPVSDGYNKGISEGYVSNLYPI